MITFAGGAFSLADQGIGLSPTNQANPNELDTTLPISSFYVGEAVTTDPTTSTTFSVPAGTTISSASGPAARTGAW